MRCWLSGGLKFARRLPSCQQSGEAWKRCKSKRRKRWAARLSGLMGGCGNFGFQNKISILYKLGGLLTKISRPRVATSCSLACDILPIVGNTPFQGFFFVVPVSCSESFHLSRASGVAISPSCLSCDPNLWGHSNLCTHPFCTTVIHVQWRLRTKWLELRWAYFSFHQIVLIKES